jgi:hypothetical protein
VTHELRVVQELGLTREQADPWSTRPATPDDPSERVYLMRRG